MTKSILCCAVALAAGIASAIEGTTVDFTAKPKTIRRALFGSGWGGTLTGPQSKTFMDVKAMGFTAARTHDWALNNPGQRIIDYYHVFPLLAADTQNPSNYFFGPSDEILAMTVEDLGLNVMYRMGTSIESVNARRGAARRPAKYYNSVEPADWEQFAKLHAQIIRHYTEGWADGFRWGDKMQYWELWNEPNDLPGGSWIVRDPKHATDKGYNDYVFDSFYVFVLKRLKAEFPHLKFGGPALCSYDVGFFKRLLQRCKDEGYTPDFISWHSYGTDPDRMLSQPAEARKLLDSFGFTKTELVINEWHWYPDSWWGNVDRQQLNDPITGVRGINAAVYALQVMMGVQDTCLDQNYFYGCSQSYGGPWGYREPDGSFGKHFFTLKLFGDVLRECDAYVPTHRWSSESPVRAFGAFSRDGEKAYLIATSYRGQSKSFEVQAPGLENYEVVSVTAVDATRDGERMPASFVQREGDGFFFTKPDAARAAAYRVNLQRKSK